MIDPKKIEGTAEQQFGQTEEVDNSGVADLMTTAAQDEAYYFDWEYSSVMLAGANVIDPLDD